MALSQQARSISETPTLALDEKALRLRQRGEAVIHLGIGRPKNKTPIAAVHAAAAKLADGDIKYTPADGLPSLKKAVIRYTEDSYHRLVAPALRFSQRHLDAGKIIVINGISKLYGMTGFPIGWAVASRPVIEVMTNAQAQTTSCPSSLLQAAAEGR
jgi:aspartate/methionine/tyrosine aminotransferase